MPVLQRRYAYTKIWRPSGTRYAEAYRLIGKNSWRSMLHALEEAWQLYRMEFGSNPDRARLVVEITGTAAGFSATVIELPEEAYQPGTV